MLYTSKDGNNKQQYMHKIETLTVPNIPLESTGRPAHEVLLYDLKP